MSRSQQKIVQYLKEARASELALVRVLQSQIAMTPRGTYRTGLEQHLFETREHARALGARAGELRHGFNPIALAFGVGEIVVGQALALSKTPLDLVRGTGGEEKLLKNAKDAAATETLEIATYTALERLARLAGDTTTAELAARIRGEEERMLDRLLAVIPELTDAVYASDVGGDPSYDPTTTGAADTVRGVAGAASDAASQAKDVADDTAAKAKDAADDGASKAKDAADDTAAKSRDAADDGASKVKEAVKDAASKAKETAAEATEAAQDTAADAKDAVDDAAAKAKDAAEDTAAKAKDSVSGAKDAVVDAASKA
jgi:ferritin-like metal-binding protein YciE